MNDAGRTGSMKESESERVGGWSQSGRGGVILRRKPEYVNAYGERRLQKFEKVDHYLSG